MKKYIKNKEARKLLRRLNKDIIKCQELPKDMEWDEAVKAGVTVLYNMRSNISDEPIGEISLYDILNNNYKSWLGMAHELHVEVGEADDDLNKLFALIPQLPSDLPKEYTKYDLDLEPLLTSLWYYIESPDNDDFTFGLGDDGTDEMEQALCNLNYILTAYQDKYFSGSRNLYTDPIFVIIRWTIEYELLGNDVPSISYFSINQCWNILNKIIKDDYYSNPQYDYFISYLTQRIYH